MSTESRSPRQLAMRRFRRNRRAVFCLYFLLLLGLGTIAVPLLSSRTYYEQVLKDRNQSPSATYWMGTDSLGRDMLVRVFWGGRISFAVALLSTLVSVMVGIVYGAVSGFFGGKTDQSMMRFVDVLYGLPHMFIVIIVMTFVGRSFAVVFLVLGLFGWMTLARIVRGQILSLKEREFVEAARALGARSGTLIFRHMIPNILGPVIVYATLTIPAVMLQEAFLSFLGLGFSAPEASWGALIDEGAKVLNPPVNRYWMVAGPGLCLAATLFCLNAIGDGLRDAFDVQQRAEGK